jgi:hypothetical protein
MIRKVSAEREELGQKPPGATVRQPCPHFRQCPLVFGGAPIGHEFRCRAQCRPGCDRAWTGFESRHRHLDRAEQRIQPPGPGVLQRPEVPATRAAAVQRAVFRDTGLNQMPLRDGRDQDLEDPGGSYADRALPEQAIPARQLTEAIRGYVAAPSHLMSRPGDSGVVDSVLSRNCPVETHERNSH